MWEIYRACLCLSRSRSSKAFWVVDEECEECDVFVGCAMFVSEQRGDCSTSIDKESVLTALVDG